MASKKLIVVIGATGIQGGSVAETFLADQNWSVRAITRNKSGAKAQALHAQGAEVVEANLNDVASLEKAFQGAQAVFGVTDYWNVYADQSFRQSLEPGQDFMVKCFDVEVQQGKNIFDAAATVPTLERLVYSSLPNTNKLSNGKYTKAYHFEAKAIGPEYAQQKYPELWSKTSVIQLGMYLTNYLSHPWMMPSKNAETGIYEIKSFDAHVPFPMVAAEKDTGTLVKALVAAKAGVNLAAVRTWMTLKEYTELCSQVLGVKVGYVEGPLEQVPEELKSDMDDTFAFAKEYDFYGANVDKSVVSPAEFDPSLDLGTVEDWIKAQDWSHIVKT